MPKSYRQFLKLVVAYYDNDNGNEYELKKLCKKHLISFVKNDNEENVDEEEPDIALPFFIDLQEFTFKPPKIGYYFMTFFKKVICLIMILRLVDWVTDFALTIKYLQDFDDTIEEFLNQTLCTNQTKPCPDEEIQKCRELQLSLQELQEMPIACIIPNMHWWIPGKLGISLHFSFFAKK